MGSGAASCTNVSPERRRDGKTSYPHLTTTPSTRIPIGSQSLKQLQRDVMTNLRDQIAERLAQKIDASHWQAGERLPSERALAGSMGVSRPVIREALRILEDSGLVRVDPAKGTFVRLEADMEPALRGHLVASLGDVSLSDLAESRRTIEGHIAALAAARANEQDIDGLRFYLDMMENSIDRPSIFKQADIAFHRQLSVATKSPIYVAWIDLILRTINQQRHDVNRQPHVRERILTCHRAIYDAVASHDPERARAGMCEHVEQFVSDVIADRNATTT